MGEDTVLQQKATRRCRVYSRKHTHRCLRYNFKLVPKPLSHAQTEYSPLFSAVYIYTAVQTIESDEIE